MTLKHRFISFLILLISLNGICAEAKITVEHKKKDADYTSYTELYVQNIDLRDMTFEVYDDDKRSFETGRLDEKLLNDLALELYDYFLLNIKEIIPVNENQDIDPSQKALILNIKLSGRFRSEDMGLINWMITKSKSVETNLSLECRLLDAQTKEELAVFTDEHVLISPDHEQPLTSPEESEMVSDIFRVWSTRFARALEQMRDGETVDQ
ncbi:MAG: hypothetical protein AB7S78_09830 [Candidatus Omnitrophota bacterium]